MAQGLDSGADVCVCVCCFGIASVVGGKILVDAGRCVSWLCFCLLVQGPDSDVLCFCVCRSTAKDGQAIDSGVCDYSLYNMISCYTCASKCFDKSFYSSSDTCDPVAGPRSDLLCDMDQFFLYCQLHVCLCVCASLCVFFCLQRKR